MTAPARNPRPHPRLTTSGAGFLIIGLSIASFLVFVWVFDTLLPPLSDGEGGTYVALSLLPTVVFGMLAATHFSNLTRACPVPSIGPGVEVPRWASWLSRHRRIASALGFRFLECGCIVPTPRHRWEQDGGYPRLLGVTDASDKTTGETEIWLRRREGPMVKYRPAKEVVGRCSSCGTYRYEIHADGQPGGRTTIKEWHDTVPNRPDDDREVLDEEYHEVVL